MSDPWCCNPDCDKAAVYELGRKIPSNLMDPTHMAAVMDYTHSCAAEGCLKYLMEPGYIIRTLEPGEDPMTGVHARTAKN